MNTEKIRASGACPVCRKTFFFDVASVPESFSTICSHCKADLLVEDDVIYPLHEYLHQHDARWPKNGQGTGFLMDETAIYRTQPPQA